MPAVFECLAHLRDAFNSLAQNTNGPAPSLPKTGSRGERQTTLHRECLPMMTSAYERAIFGRSANDDHRPPRPNVIDEAIKAFGGRGHYRHSWKGHEFWRNGRWNGPYTLQGFIKQANIVLKGDGKPQISANPALVITEAEVCI